MYDLPVILTLIEALVKAPSRRGFLKKMEEIAKNITLTIGHVLEIVSATIIAAALVKLLFLYFRSYLKEKNGIPVTEARLTFGSAVAVSLEILLGADVLATAVAPSWDDIGKLAAIATIRTVLNYFLEKELSHSKEQSPGYQHKAQ